jgi:hypothetical protein
VFLETDNQHSLSGFKIASHWAAWCCSNALDLYTYTEFLLFNANMKAAVEINAYKTKYMFMPYHQNAGQNYTI